MKRWAVCKMGDWELDGSRGPKVALYTSEFRLWQSIGKSWSLVHFATNDLTAIAADADIKLIPDATLDLTWNSIGTAIRNRVVNELQAAGLQTSGITSSMTVREVLNYIAGQFRAGIDVGLGDIKDR